MQQNGISSKKFIIIGTTTILILFVTIIIISVLSLFDHSEQLVIDNFSDYYNLSNEGKKEIFMVLHGQVKNEMESIPTSGAIIRDGSTTFNYDEKTKIYSGDFIVDIDSIQRTYLMSFQWSDNEYLASGISVSCPTKSVDKYNTGINCINSLNEKEQDLLLVLLPSYIDINNELTAFVSLKHYGNSINDPYLEINVDSCGNLSLINLTKTKVEEWLEDHYLKKDIVPFEIRDLCDGGF